LFERLSSSTLIVNIPRRATAALERGCCKKKYFGRVVPQDNCQAIVDVEDGFEARVFVQHLFEVGGG
jgi:hypothetical protein